MTAATATLRPPRPLPAPPALRMGDLAALARVMRKLPAVAGPDPVARKRQLLAAFCRLLAAQFDETPGIDPPAPPASSGPAANGQGLSPRVAQTLERLLAGDSEKEAAARLGLSRNTLHVYVKALYRHFGVSSRGELFARFVRPDVVPPPRRQRAATGANASPHLNR